MSSIIPFKFEYTGSGAIAESSLVPSGDPLFLISISLHLDGTPTTSENLTFTLDANAGAEYDTLIYSLDLSAAGAVDILWLPDSPILLVTGDSIDIAYLNTDGNTYGLQVTMKLKE